MNRIDFSQYLNGTKNGFEAIGLHVSLERFVIGPPFHPDVTVGGIDAFKNTALDTRSGTFMADLLCIRQYFKRLYEFVPVPGGDVDQNFKTDHPLLASN
jgi:hypothetical protein